MNKMIDWIGKTEDCEMAFSLDIAERGLLPSSANADVEEDTIEIEWEESASLADRIDCGLAVASGSIAGLIDIFFVGEFSLDKANDWGAKKVNAFVEFAAKLSGCKNEGLDSAIRYLESNFEMAADGATNNFGGGRQHHLRDFSHHFSLGGLVCSLFTQFTGKVIGTDAAGNIKIAAANPELIGTTFEERVFLGVAGWFFHLASDMAGSSSNPGKGTGIPGPLLSTIKEFSALPFFKDSEQGGDGLRHWTSKLFSDTPFAKRNESSKITESVRFDLRSEIGMLHELGKQATPVLVNECIVRSLFFLRRLLAEFERARVRSLDDLQRINVASVLPCNNRAMSRMVTIASGTFFAIDAADAAVRTAIANKNPKNPRFWTDLVVRINVVGAGRFAVACVMDIRQVRNSIRESNARERRSAAEVGQLMLTPSQLRLLSSMERQIVAYDAFHENDSKKKTQKESWLVAWEKSILEGSLGTERTKGEYFYRGKGLFNACDDELRQCSDFAWFWLVMLEASLFEPYFDLPGHSVERRTLKRKKDFLIDAFCPQCARVDQRDIESLRKAFKKNQERITGQGKKNVIKAAGTAVAIVATGGLGFVAAPAIAPAIATTLFGEAVAGLSGAALTSASLAAIGGGSIAAGGLGMAGGSAIIAGGGALLGLAGGSAITSATLYEKEGFVLTECAKLLTFSNEILIGRLDDHGAAASVERSLSDCMKEAGSEITSLKRKSATKEQKKKAKALESSSKYMQKTLGLMDDSHRKHKKRKKVKGDMDLG